MAPSTIECDLFATTHVTQFYKESRFADFDRALDEPVDNIQNNVLLAYTTSNCIGLPWW